MAYPKNPKIFLTSAKFVIFFWKAKTSPFNFDFGQKNYTKNFIISQPITPNNYVNFMF